MAKHLSIPNDWLPRAHQCDIWNYMALPGDSKRAVAVWHRRAGKDSTALNFTAAEMFKDPGVYWHMLPTTVQARKVVWNGIDNQGRRIIDQAFPPELRKRTNNQEMLIELKTGPIAYDDDPLLADSRVGKSGSIWQLCGSDNYDSLVGSNPKGVVFSEYSLADPAAWDYIRPILVENGGWAIFIYTPRGKNHGNKLYTMALENPLWHCELLTIEDTYREDGSPIVTQAQVDEELNAGMPIEKIRQEFFCSWEAGMEGALYTSELTYASENKLHGHYPWDPDRPCITVWDIGIRDDTVIGIFQSNEFGRPVLIDHIHGRNKGMDTYWKELKELPYMYGGHYGPHDLKQREYSTARSRIELAAEMGLEFELVPKLLLEDGINAARSFIKRLYVHVDRNGYVIDGISSYRRQYDEKKRLWMEKPEHDWASHPSDMIRYAAIIFNSDLFGNQGVNHKVRTAMRNVQRSR